MLYPPKEKKNERKNRFPIPMRIFKYLDYVCVVSIIWEQGPDLEEAANTKVRA